MRIWHFNSKFGERRLPALSVSVDHSQVIIEKHQDYKTLTRRSLKAKWRLTLPLQDATSTVFLEKCLNRFKGTHKWHVNKPVCRRPPFGLWQIYNRYLISWRQEYIYIYVCIKCKILFQTKIRLTKAVAKYLSSSFLLI